MASRAWQAECGLALIAYVAVFIDSRGTLGTVVAKTMTASPREGLGEGWRCLSVRNNAYTAGLVLFGRKIRDFDARELAEEILDAAGRDAL